MAVGKQQHGVTVHRPEAAQHITSGIGQRYQPVLIALGVADMHTPAHGIDIADLQAKPLTETQPHAVDGEVEDPLAESLSGGEQPCGLFDGNDIGQALGLGWLDQIDIDPRFVEHMGIEELEPVEIELDRTPGVGRKQIGEIVRELLL